LADTTGLLSQFYISVNGEPLNATLGRNLEEATVENSLHLPDVAVLRLNDPQGRWVDDPRLGPGKTLEITARSGREQHPLFDGEIVELEPDFVPGARHLVVRAFDRLHRLSRGRQVRSFQNVTDGDLVQRVAREAGLKARVAPTTQVHNYVLQDNRTNLEFLRGRAAALGYLLYVEGKTLCCEPPEANGSPLSLDWGGTLQTFHPRLSTIGQVDGATARGWDPATRREIVGRAKQGRGGPDVGAGKQGGEVAHKAFDVSAELLVSDRAIRQQAVADQLAQALMDRTAGRFVEAEGLAIGTPALVAGISVKLSGLGSRFSGTYFVTGAVHTYNAAEGYTTHFQVSGHHPATLLSLLGVDGVDRPEPVLGLVVGIVTDNQDPQGQGRVKVRYPSLSGEHASDWARVVAPGAGPERGLELVPEVNDEVVVGFEHGDVHFPYVLGGLWNGQDAAPRPSNQIVGGGKVKQRILRSRLGHTITLDDSDDQPGITIVDKTGRNTIALDSKANKLSVQLDGDVAFQAKGKVSIKGASIEVQADSSLSMKGASTNVEATGAISVKGATANLEGNAATNVKGGVVNIN
jgi:phage protein D/phage baseplate assembly protein gpV